MANIRKNQFFCIKCEPGPKTSSFQFASIVEFHLRCQSHGTDCDFVPDWDGKSLFWLSDWMDWSETQEQDVMDTLKFFVKRWLREQKLPESEILDYIRFTVIKTA